MGVEKKEDTEPSLISNLLSLLEQDTAGSPSDSEVKWTSLRPREIVSLYKQKYQTSLSTGTVKRILRKVGYRKRRPSKALLTGKSPFRSAQFKLIFYFASLFADLEHNPIISIDTKKKERLGQLDRAGKVLCDKAPKVFDHDYSYLSEGKIIPQGIYDMKANQGYLTVGTSKENAEFIADNLIWWWETFAKSLYPNATHILLFCDAGGANDYRHYAFKKAIIEVAQRIGIKILVVHYPPYCSKWNPIEQRLFSQIHHQAKGFIFYSYQQVKEIYQRTSTKTGLKVEVRISHKEYQIGIKINPKEIEGHKIIYHDELPQFNYTILP